MTKRMKQKGGLHVTLFSTSRKEKRLELDIHQIMREISGWGYPKLPHNNIFSTEKSVYRTRLFNLFLFQFLDMPQRYDQRCTAISFIAE